MSAQDIVQTLPRHPSTIQTNQGILELVDAGRGAQGDDVERDPQAREEIEDLLLTAEAGAQQTGRHHILDDQEARLAGHRLLGPLRQRIGGLVAQ